MNNMCHQRLYSDYTIEDRIVEYLMMNLMIMIEHMQEILD